MDKGMGCEGWEGARTDPGFNVSFGTLWQLWQGRKVQLIIRRHWTGTVVRSLSKPTR